MKNLFKVTKVVLILLLISCENNENEFVLESVELVSPEIAELNQPLNVSLQWESKNSQDIEYEYEVYLGTESDNLRLVHTNKENQLNLDALKYECYALNLQTEYFWKVRIKNEDTFADSKIFSFTTTDKLPYIEFGDHRLEVFPSDIFPSHRDSVVFYAKNSLSGATSWTDGIFNTQKLFRDFDKYPKEGLSLAAKICYELNAYGHDDWYLPSIVELDSINSKLELTKMTDDIYLSSTEYEQDWNFCFVIPKNRRFYNLGVPYDIQNKHHNCKFRCVRKE